MKILFTVTYYHPYVSGLTIAASRFAHGLKKAGHRVMVLAIKHTGDLAEQERIHGVVVSRAKYLIKISKGFVSFDWLIKSWELVRNNDVIVVNLPQFEGVVPALFAKLMGKRLIVLYHCEVVLPEGFFNSVAQSLLEVANMASLLLADEVVTYTRDYAKESRLLQYVSSKLHFIVPPIPNPRVNAVLFRKLQKKIGSADITIGMSARLAAEKGIEYLFAAIPLIQKQLKGKKIKVVIAGPLDPAGERPYKKKIIDFTNKYKYIITLLGEVAPEKIGSFYRLLDVLILPSVNSTESFGMVQVEAMLSGVPVVASNLPGVRVPIQKTKMGVIVPPRDSEALAQAIVTVVSEPDRYHKPLPAVRKHFSEERSQSAFSELLYA